MGEVDALLGCGTFHLLDPRYRVDHYKDLNRWDQVTRHYDMELTHDRTTPITSLIESLKMNNLYQLSAICSDSLEKPDYEILWRLGRWDFNETPKTINQNNHFDYNKLKFGAFKALHDHDAFSFDKSISDLSICFIEKLAGVNLESSKNFYDILTQLQSVKEMEDFYKTSGDEGKIYEMVEQWRKQDEIVENNFQYVEPITVQRIVMLTQLSELTNEKLRKSVVNLMLDFAGIYSNSIWNFVVLYYIFSVFENRRTYKYCI